MSKSLRSKWKRKMKAVKRERYGAKELDRLNKMLAACGELPTKTDLDVKVEPAESTEGMEGEVEAPIAAPAASVIIPVISRKRRKPRKPKGEGRKSRRDVDDEEAEDGDYEDVVEMEDLGSAGEGPDKGEDSMAVDGKEKTEHVFSKRSMRDQFGNYPAWMNKRKMKTQQNKNKRIAKRRALSVSGKRRK